ncbi:hypothetical protein N2W37_000760 [Clostridium perfringens]|uniref:hypothetical protein n=1 Tax=Clostridium perfringens TaxID=1502 RepID=UPI0024BD163E|nr:hypothetical protein [Clostridium perfringens]EJT5921728.1 hypothetical protein [Clostridium perfringens]MDM0714627.1 hypothetical protein [Clostridium perfringens]MDU6311266.1 hypothetical protein [Clostridium perfringens]
MTNKKTEENKLKEIEEKETCFVIMPISDNNNYEKGHFNFVYEDIFKPAIESAGFKPYRVDENKSSSVIHLEIIKALLDAPMAICDLSSKNPNVLYELGIRQAFDKPVVLVGDNNPGEIFDIGNINTYKYDKVLSYRSVIKDQNEISEMIKKTYDNHNKGIDSNSLIKLLNINSAAQSIDKEKDLNEKDLLTMMYNEILSLKQNQNNSDIDFKEYKELVDRVNNVIEFIDTFGGDDELFNNTLNSIKEFEAKYYSNLSKKNRLSLDMLRNKLLNQRNEEDIVLNFKKISE